MVTSEYVIEVLNSEGRFLRRAGVLNHYKEARYFVKDNPLADSEHYRIIRIDYIDDEEVGTECAYEEGVSTYIEGWGENG